MNYIPIIIELRKVQELSETEFTKEDCITNLIIKAFESCNSSIPIKESGNRLNQLGYALTYGKFLVLLDGLDEVVSERAELTEKAIQYFSKKYHKNSVIVSSRSDISYMLESFTKLKTKPLSKEEALEIAGNFVKPQTEELQKFIEKLDSQWYKKYKDYAQSPLLLSIMFLTFSGNGDIPDHLVDFFGQAYDTLYSRHDLKNKQGYRREFRSKGIDKDAFAKIYSHFCFHSLYDETYEFSKPQIMDRLKSSIESVCRQPLLVKDYLTDLIDNVCLIVKDGEVYRFCHRDFQSYFAAEYLRRLSDDKQKTFYHNYVRKARLNFLFYSVVIQMEEERFTRNCLKPGLEYYIDNVPENIKYIEEHGSLVITIIQLSGKKKYNKTAFMKDLPFFDALYAFLKPKYLGNGVLRLEKEDYGIPCRPRSKTEIELDMDSLLHYMLDYCNEKTKTIESGTDPVHSF